MKYKTPVYKNHALLGIFFALITCMAGFSFCAINPFFAWDQAYFSEIGDTWNNGWLKIRADSTHPRTYSVSKTGELRCETGRVDDQPLLVDYWLKTNLVVQQALFGDQYGEIQTYRFLGDGSIVLSTYKQLILLNGITDKNPIIIKPPQLYWTEIQCSGELYWIIGWGALFIFSFLATLQMLLKLREVFGWFLLFLSVLMLPVGLGIFLAMSRHIDM